MKILMSAFSCGPGRGSDPGIGWNMAVETARLGHEVVVLTQPQFRAEIALELASGKLPDTLQFDIFMPTWLQFLRDTGLRAGYDSLTWHGVSILWQFCALHRAARRHVGKGFDLIHHVTLSGIRHPTLLQRLGLPIVIGPIGGGERAPMAMRRSLSFKSWCTELLRDAHSWILRADPITRSAFLRAELIVLRTEESLVAVPPRCRDKVLIQVGMGVAETPQADVSPRAAGEPLRLIFAGRLLFWKGAHLAIRSVAQARAQGVDATLTVVGDGPARRSLEQLASELKVASYVDFKGKVPRHSLLDLYRHHHVLLFPSLHDAGGTVVIEAWGCGLPVICLALGGPGKMVDESCGCVVPVTNGGEKECVTRLAAEISALATDEPRRLALGRSAIARCDAFSWKNVVAHLYAEIEKRMRNRARPGLRQFDVSTPGTSGTNSSLAGS